MKQTENYGLNQWEMTDRIRMEDFNGDNSKVDAALAARNCQFYTEVYTGDGATSRTFTFPHKPMFVLVVSSALFMLAVQGSEQASLIHSLATHQAPSLTWSGNSMTISSGYNTYAVNETTSTYHLFALLSLS